MDDISYRQGDELTSAFVAVSLLESFSSLFVFKRDQVTQSLSVHPWRTLPASVQGFKDKVMTVLSDGDAPDAMLVAGVTTAPLRRSFLQLYCRKTHMEETPPGSHWITWDGWKMLELGNMSSQKMQWSSTCQIQF